MSGFTDPVRMHAAAHKLSPVGTPQPRSHGQLLEEKSETYVNHLFDFNAQSMQPSIPASPMHRSPFVPPVATCSSTSRIGTRPRSHAPAACARPSSDDGSQGVGSASGSDSEDRDSWECEPGQVWRMHNECGSPGDLRLWREEYEEPWQPDRFAWHTQEPCCAPGQLWRMGSRDEVAASEGAASGGISVRLGSGEHAVEARQGDADAQHTSDASTPSPAGVL